MADPIARRGFMLVLSSPSGAGKTTLTRALLRRDPQFSMSVSATTRPRRPGETEGVDYRFVSHAAFEAMVRDRMARTDGPFLFGEWSAVDAMYAPVAARLSGYSWPMEDATRAYVGAVQGEATTAASTPVKKLPVVPSRAASELPSPAQLPPISKTPERFSPTRNST